MREHHKGDHRGTSDHLLLFTCITSGLLPHSSPAVSASLSKATTAPSRTSTRHGLLNSDGPSSIPGDPRRGTWYRFRGCAARIRSDSSQPARTGAAGWVSFQCAGAAEDGQHTRADRARRVRRHGARDAADAACAVRGHGVQAAGKRERTRVACGNLSQRTRLPPAACACSARSLFAGQASGAVIASGRPRLPKGPRR